AVLPGRLGQPQPRRPPPPALAEPGQRIPDGGLGRREERRQQLVVHVAPRAAPDGRRAEQERQQRPLLGPRGARVLAVEVAELPRQHHGARVAVVLHRAFAQLLVQPVGHAPWTVRVHVQDGLLGEQHFEMVRQPGGTHLGGPSPTQRIGDCPTAPYGQTPWPGTTAHLPRPPRVGGRSRPRRQLPDGRPPWTTP